MTTDPKPTTPAADKAIPCECFRPGSLPAEQCKAWGCIKSAPSQCTCYITGLYASSQCTGPNNCIAGYAQDGAE